ncbi:hypothetical protein D3C86_1979810 [compost metagenome]
MLVQIGDDHIRSFFGISDGHGPADSAVASCDKRSFSHELTCGFVLAVFEDRSGIHFRFESRLPVLMLGRECLLLLLCCGCHV